MKSAVLPETLAPLPEHFGLFVSKDVLVLIVPVPGRYPSVNHTGADAFRGGRKSKAYRDLFSAVQRLGEEAVRLGWVRIESPARLSITRYAPTRAARDAVNLGTAEANALTKAGVWSDDALGTMVDCNMCVDPDGPDRVLIMVQRFTALSPLPRTNAPAKRKRVATSAPAQEPPPVAGRVAYVQGRPVPYEDALAMILGRR